jgi:hypothetical protein
MIQLLIGLYPARWRARYGDEFAAVLEERPLGPFDVADILLGAIDAQLHLRGLGAASPTGKGSIMSLRIGGIAAISGALLWFLGLVFGSASETATAFEALTLIAVVLGTVLLLVALVGLSSFQARRHPRLIWAAFAIPAVGAIISLAGMGLTAALGDRPLIGEYTAWYVWLVGTLALIVGSGLFGLATWRTRALSRPGAALLGVGSLAIVPVLVNLAGDSTEASTWTAFVVTVLAFASGWLLLGIGAVRSGRSPATSLEGASL